MPKGAGRAAQDPARVAQRQGKPRLAMDKYVLAGLKAYPNQDGGLGRSALDLKSYAAFSDHLNTETSGAFNRPMNGLRTHASTFRQFDGRVARPCRQLASKRRSYCASVASTPGVHDVLREKRNANCEGDARPATAA